MQRRRLLLLATTLLLISAEPGRGSEQPLEPPGGLEGAEDAFMERRPQIQLWIRMRGPYTKYVIASLKKAVTQNGMTCQEISPGGIYLRCQLHRVGSMVRRRRPIANLDGAFPQRREKCGCGARVRNRYSGAYIFERDKTKWQDSAY
jgi:hypothetical protein